MAYYLKGYDLCRWPPLVPRGCHLRGLVSPFRHSGNNLASREDPGGAILAPRDYPGGPWTQQDGHEVVRNRIFIDFGVIMGPVYISFLISRSLTFHLFRACFGLVCGPFFVLISESKFRRLGLKIRGFRKDSLAKINCSQILPSKIRWAK